MTENTPQYKPGDMANGFVLTEDNQWVPVIGMTPPAPKKRKHTGLKVVGGVVGAIVAISVISAAASGGSDTPTAVKHDTTITQHLDSTPSATPTEDQGVETPSEAPAVETPSQPPATTEAPAPSKPAKPAMTTSQEQAVQSAESYLDMGGFSRQGLIDQLHSPYGEQFSLQDATFAVTYLHPNWNEQAVLSAKSYLDMGGFSRQGLIDQLTSEYGEQFTQAQAEYAVNKVGL